jgi:hypothetical protein
MPEINNKNVVEQSRTEIHSDDTFHLKELSKKVEQNSKDLQAHCKQNVARDKIIDSRDAKTEKKIDQLLPLVELVPLLKQMVDEKRAYTIIAAKVLKWIGVLGALVGLVYGAIKLWQEIKK